MSTNKGGGGSDGGRTPLGPGGLPTGGGGKATPNAGKGISDPKNER